MKKFKEAQKRAGDRGRRRAKGKQKKGGGASKRAKKKSNSRVQKLQRKLDAKAGKVATLRRQNACLQQQARREERVNVQRTGQGGTRRTSEAR
jgi:hypothetical protein